MIDVFQVANAMALTSTCCKCKEGGVVVDTATGNVVSVCRSRCTHGYSICAHKHARDCPCFVSAYGDLVVQGTEKLKGTQIYVVSESYPTPVDGSELTRYLSLCGAEVISFNKIGATLSNKSKELNASYSECCEHDTTKKRKHGFAEGNTYGTSTCPTCGKTFVKTSPRQKYCNTWRIGVCDVCHKVFQYKCSARNTSKPSTCGNPECVKSVRVRNFKWNK